jgi:hypothetical protein
MHLLIARCAMILRLGDCLNGDGFSLFSFSKQLGPLHTLSLEESLKAVVERSRVHSVEFFRQMMIQISYANSKF